jgi:hypothetical protein
MEMLCARNDKGVFCERARVFRLALVYFWIHLGFLPAPNRKCCQRGVRQKKNETSMIRKVDIWILSVGAGVSGKMKYFRLRLKRKFDTCGYGEGFREKGVEADFLVLR